MPRHNCSVLQRLCKDIKFNKRTNTLEWHGRYRPAVARSNPTSLYHFPTPEFSYSQRRMNVNRFLFFQLYEITGQVPQERLKLMYSSLGLPLLKNELSISLFTTVADAVMERTIRPALGSMSMPSVPLLGKLRVRVQSDQAQPYATIPIEFPEYKGEDRIPLIMHYLHGGTDADRPAPLRTRPAAKLPTPTKGRTKK